MNNTEEVRVPKEWKGAIKIEDNKVYCAEFRVGSAPEKEGTVMDISWESKGIDLGRITKRLYLNISPEQTLNLWEMQDHKTLQKDLEECKGNYEKIDFKHCMKKYEKGGDRITKNWSVRFLSHHDFEIITQIERDSLKRRIIGLGYLPVN